MQCSAILSTAVSVMMMQERPASDFDIEHIPQQNDEGQYIEMDLACGLFDLPNDSAAMKAAERLVAAGPSLENGLASDTDSSDSDGTSSEISFDTEDESESVAMEADEAPGQGDMQGHCSTSNSSAQGGASAHQMEMDAQPTQGEQCEHKDARRLPPSGNDGSREQQAKRRPGAKQRKPKILEL